MLNPIERMIEKVKLIAKNPMLAASDEVEEAGLFGMLDNKAGKKKKDKEKQN